MKMEICPISYKEACEFVNNYHRHHKAPQGHKFSIGLINDEDKLIGVAIVGRPIARLLDNGLTLEVTRLCTDGTENACSKLYSACWRVVKNMGYKKLITYILSSETGNSVRASGWKLIGERGGGTWNRKGREREDKHPTQTKLLFEITN